MERGDPISYMVLKKGTAVESSDGVEVGRVRKVLEVPEKDVFDGLVIDTPIGKRFADGPDVEAIYENAVVLKLSAEAVTLLPDHPGAPGRAKNAAKRGARRTARRLFDWWP